MARFDAAAFDYSPANDWSTEEVTRAKPAKQVPAWSESESPTRPLPVFRLEEEARRLDEAAAAASAAAAKAAACGDDATVTVSAEDNLKLLASVFAGASNDASHAAEVSDTGPVTKRSSVAPSLCTDDEPTLDAPAPSTPEALASVSMKRPVRVTARPPALKTLVITRPPPAPHTPRASIVPALATAEATEAPAPLVASSSGLHLRIDRVESRPAATTYRNLRSTRDMQTYLVVGIWAMALSLLAVLMFMATSSA